MIPFGLVANIYFRGGYYRKDGAHALGQWYGVRLLEDVHLHPAACRPSVFRCVDKDAGVGPTLNKHFTLELEIFVLAFGSQPSRKIRPGVYHNGAVFRVERAVRPILNMPSGKALSVKDRLKGWLRARKRNSG